MTANYSPPNATPLLHRLILYQPKSTARFRSRIMLILRRRSLSLDKGEVIAQGAFTAYVENASEC